MAQVVNKEVVKIIGGSAGHSEKPHVGNYASLEYKQENGFKGNIFVAHASQEVQDLCKSLDDNMGEKITLVTSIEVENN